MRCMFRRLFGNKSPNKSSSNATGRVGESYGRNLKASVLQNITFWDNLKKSAVLNADGEFSCAKSDLGTGDPNMYELRWSQVQMTAEVNLFNYSIWVRWLKPLSHLPFILMYLSFLVRAVLANITDMPGVLDACFVKRDCTWKES